tara:strand:+ start:305 stop:490 length:186 start_codon:yes stop_codon:yes gene_type:complete
MMEQCPKLVLAEMQKSSFVLGGLLKTDEMLKQHNIIEAEMYALQTLLEKYYEIKNCKVTGT